MSKLQVAKTVVSLPEQLTANTVYFIRVGQGFDLCCTDALGQVAYKINALTQDDLDNAFSELLSTLGTAATANVTTSSTDTTAGRVVKVGDFGTGSGIFVTNAEDLNNILDPGNYAFGGSTANSPAPGTGDGIMAVFGRRDVDVMQLANQSTSTPLYFRKNDSSPTTNEGWAPWIPLANLNSPAFTGTPSAPSLKFGNVLSADVNTLDYYEEGTFTPVLVGSTVSGDITYAINSGRYVRIGRLVFWSARVELSSISGATGQIHLGGFPFVMTGGAAFRPGLSCAHFGNLASPAISVSGIIRNGESSYVLYVCLGAAETTRSGNIATDLTSTSRFWFNGIYETA